MIMWKKNKMKVKENNNEVNNMKEVKVICPKCGHCMIYKNWFSWIWHTPFHWFRKRKVQCTNCGEVSYIKKEK